MQQRVKIGTGEAASILGKSPDTVRRWAKRGKLQHIQYPSGQIEFYRDDIERVMQPVGPSPAGDEPVREKPTEIEEQQELAFGCGS